MDYRSYSLQEYGQLVLDMPVVVRTLASKLSRMEKRSNFKPENGYMFGFSFGAHVVLRAGKKYGHQRLHEVDGELQVLN
jgi:predicted esterase